MGDYTKEERVDITETGSAQREPIVEDPVEDDNQEEDTTPVSGIQGTLTLASVAGFILVPERDNSEKAIQQIDADIKATNENKTLTEEQKEDAIKELRAKRITLSEQRHAILRDAESVFNTHSIKRAMMKPKPISVRNW